MEMNLPNRHQVHRQDHHQGLQDPHQVMEMNLLNHHRVRPQNHQVWHHLSLVQRMEMNLLNCHRVRLPIQG